MKAVGATLRGRGVLRAPAVPDRGRVRQRSFSVLANGSPPARPRRGLADSGAISAAAVAARRRHASASSERPVSVERLLSSSKASWAIASSAQQEQSAFTDDDELERRLNGPDAIAAATATAAASSSRRRSRAGTTGAARAAPRTCSNPNTVSSHGTARSMLVEPTPDMEVEDDSLGDCVNTRTAGRSGANGRSMAAITNTADDVFDLDDSSLGAPNGSRFDSLGMASVGRHKGATEVDAAGGGRQMRDLDTVLDDFQTSVPEKRHDTQRHNDRQPSARHRPAPSSDVFAGIRGLDEDGDEDEQDGAARIDNAELWRMQIEREQRSQAEACEKYCKMLDDMVSYGKVSNLKPVQRILLTWYRPLMERIEQEQAAVWQKVPDVDKEMVSKSGSFGGRNIYGPLLVLLKADKLAVLVMHEVVNLCLSEGNRGVPTLKACEHVANLVQQEVHALRLRNKLGNKKMKKLNMHMRKHVRQVNAKAETALESLEYDDWPLAARIKLGAALIKYLLETASWSEDGRPAFYHEVRSTHVKRRHGVVAMNSAVYSKMIEEDVSTFVEPRFVPMLVPPRDWTRTDKGGYLNLRTQAMRTWGDKGQKEALRLAELGRVFKGLNCLGKVKWRVNSPILDLAAEAWEREMEIGDLPKRGEIPLPEVPKGLKFNPNGVVKIARKEDMEDPEMIQTLITFRRSVRKVKTKNANLHSLRCDLQIKMSIAEEFRDHIFYFPYNMDFRGRTYPVPPNLNILGSDFCRGVLMFDEARPLGERGMYWLKVHLANLFGQDKISFDDRVSFVEKHLDEIRDSAKNPLDGNGWWIAADKPWQCLSACKELTGALESPDPLSYLSRLPVHQDGSCNGLQHYAALGLDAIGGAQVNLVPSGKPQDVYTGVCHVVNQKVTAEAVAVPPPGAPPDELNRHAMAKIVQGKINRKVVKQTVMTSVYGVTFVGARKQIQSQIEGKLNPGEVMTDEDEADAYRAASYLATHTMAVLGELFGEARSIMEWLMEVAVLVAKEGQPVTWVTPLGLPVMQPYRRSTGFQVQTLLQGVQLTEENEHLPVAIARQKSAFPPNFVHSLDSTHMLLTAIEMDKAQVPFAAVHDSYWVHAGNIDDMNAKLRQCFVDLYSGPILEDLHESIRLRFPTIDFPPIPPRGTLELEAVKDSKYFFN